MSPYDVTPDDEPLDTAAVRADDAMVEQFRRALSPDGAVIWDDDDEIDDPAFALLRGLQLDVSEGLPSFDVLPADVVSLTARRRRLGRSATVAAVAAGVLSIGGVAAAASSPGQPLFGVRTAVASAVTNVVDAITPAASDQPRRLHPTPTGRPSTSGASRSDEVTSQNAAAEATQALDKASGFLDSGKYSAAGEQLDRAARALTRVTDAAVRSPLQARLTALRARLVAAHPSPTASEHSGKGSGDSQAGDGSSTSDDKSADPSGGGKSDDSSGKSSDSSGSGKSSDSSGSDKSSDSSGKSPDATEKSGDPSGKNAGSGGSGGSQHETAVPRPDRTASSGHDTKAKVDGSDVAKPGDLVGADAHATSGSDG